MKNKTIYTILLLTCLTSSCIVAQSGNIIKERNMTLMKNGNNTKGLSLGDPIEKTIKIFKKPDSITDELTDVAGWIKTYHYGRNQLRFMENRLYRFNLKDSFIVIGTINGGSFKIGDSIKVQRGKKRFYGFTVDDTPGHAYNIDYSASISLLIEGTDSSINLLFDSQGILILIGLYAPS